MDTNQHNRSIFMAGCPITRFQICLISVAAGLSAWVSMMDLPWTMAWVNAGSKGIFPTNSDVSFFSNGFNGLGLIRI